ncbi:methionine--tRNA ligase [Priestia koreensis]|uniref:methionine--tRNA ligase n=1 Tax=Priestia koreensis TaxID=284581 RepID=UPI001F5A4034|nr:methionine--tRNA ligase [Priestia koreensis]UNL83101.1 methionine--tRNA ligase [Priestia koreensis]
MTVFIGGAWPYANGSLHLGHIASLLSGDILARYYRMKGEKVLYVSGSDCNGTPITIRAKQEGVAPKEIADRYHKEFYECFSKLGFSYDCYTRTDTQNHHHVVQLIFNELIQNGWIYKKETEQAYCYTCEQFLPDRYVEGICPHCGQAARGDQCEACSAILDPVDLLHKTCKVCGDHPTVRETEHFYFALSQLQEQIEKYVKESTGWRDNAIRLTKRYLSEGLQDRAASRDLPIGVPVPVKGYEEKKVYVWIEAVVGYYSASVEWGTKHQKSYETFWEKDVTSYYVHGKDNIPFHTIIWPALLLGMNGDALPTHIVSNEYLTLEKKKLSTSKNWAVWVPDMIERYDPDSIRYFLTINAPENRDTDFSWREFILSHNGELLGAYGNLVNRTLKFVEKYYEGFLPNGELDLSISQLVSTLYQTVGEGIEKTAFKRSLEEIFQGIRAVNKYFDEQKPWLQRQEDPQAGYKTIRTCVYSIVNFAQLLAPFLPFSSTKIQTLLGIEEWQWLPISISETTIQGIEPLFERIDVKQIEEELDRLAKQSL